VWYKRNAEGLTIYLYVQPGAKKTEITGVHDSELKIRLNTPPIEDRANKALLKYIAQIFNVPIRQVTLKCGAKSRHKILLITGSLVEPDRLFF
jgi:uncharacterized protein (TIGR00251 family)